MALQELANQAEVSGLIDNIETSDTSAIVVYMIDGLSVTKTADKIAWTSGDLGYTVVIANDTGFDYTDVVFRDTLNPALVTLDTSSVRLDAETLIEGTDFTYTPATGAFEIQRTPMITVPNGDSISITFRVNKA